MQRVTPEEAERLLHMAVSTELAFHADEIFDYAYRMYLTVPHKRVSATMCAAAACYNAGRIDGIRAERETRKRRAK